MALAVGTRLGPYEIVAPLGAGGMGEVYRARDTRLGRDVAVKVVHPRLASDPGRLSRFEKEARAAAQLDHPNILVVHDVGTHEGSPFIVSELLQGESLREKLGAPLPPKKAVDYAIQIARGLAAAHEKGIVHRDIKPENVFVTKDGHIKILDFGVAKLLPSFEKSGVDTETPTETATQPGTAIGTVAYMSPEQIRGQPVDARTDLFSFGVVLYEMLSGKRPFQRDTAPEIMTAILREEPPDLSETNRSIPAALENIVRHCLDKEPDGRFQSARDIAFAIEALPEISTAKRAAPMSPTGVWLHRHRKSLAGAAALVVVGVLSFIGIRAGLPTLKKTASGFTGAASTVRTNSPGAIAVIGLRNNSERAESAWLSTAIAEILTTELAADGKLRVVPGQEVARVRMDLGLKEAESLPTDVLRRIRQNLGVENVVLGSYTMIGDPGARLLRIDLRLVDLGTGEVLTSATTSGTEVQLFDLVSRAGASLRQKLGVGDLSARQTLEVGASLPADPEAARFYTEGLSRLRSLDIQGASGLLEKAVAAEPKHPLPHAALAAAYSKQGFETRAKAEASQAVALSGSLGHSQQLQIEAGLHEVTKEWGKAVEARRSLFQSYPGNVDYGVDLAETQIAAGKIKEAFVTLEALRKLPAPASGDARIDYLEARAFQESGDFRKQQALAVVAATKGRTSGARLLVARARLVEAMALQSQGDMQGATAAIDEARSLFDAAGDRAGTARALELTFTSVDRQGDLEGGRRLLVQALSIYREIGDRSSAARVLLNMGNVLVREGRTSEAQKLFDEALTTFQQTGAKDAAAVALNDIGMMFHNRGDLAAAQTRYQEALTLFSELGEKSGTATVLTNIAEVLQCRGDLDQAFKMHEDSLAINRAIGEKSGVAWDLYQLGEVHSLRGDLIAARDRYKEALALQEQIGDTLAAADTRLALASLALAQGRSSEAEAGAREAEEILRTQGSVDHDALALSVVAESLLAQGKVKEAQEIGGRAASLGRKSDNRRIRYATAITEARVRAASRNSADVDAALRSLDLTAADAAKASFLGSAFEARLARGEIEMASDRSASGKKRLQTLEVDARAKGFGQIARRAAAAFTNALPGD